MTSQGVGSGESKLETVVSYFLIIGVVISVLLEIIGISLFYKIYGNVRQLDSAHLCLFQTWN